jgi:hypothetical protein
VNVAFGQVFEPRMRNLHRIRNKFPFRGILFNGKPKGDCVPSYTIRDSVAFGLPLNEDVIR